MSILKEICFMEMRHTKEGYVLIDELAHRKWLEFENRKAWWISKVAQNKAKDFCIHCYKHEGCGRLLIDPSIVADIFWGYGCPDYDGVWTSIFGRR